MGKTTKLKGFVMDQTNQLIHSTIVSALILTVWKNFKKN